MREFNPGQVLISSHHVLSRRSAVGTLAATLLTISGRSAGLARKRRDRAGAGHSSSTNSPQRSISEFVSAQGQTTVFVPPVPDVLGWATPSATPVLFAWIDYAGVADGFAGLDLGTKTSGTLTERRLESGQAEIKVILHTRNALAWVIELDLNGDIFDQIANKQPLFGYRPQEAAASPYPTPSLVEAAFEIVFVHTAPGAPLPDLVAATALGEAPEGFAVRSQKFQARGGGTRRDPDTDETAPAQLTIAQTGSPRDTCVTADCFPAEIIKIQPGRR